MAGTGTGAKKYVVKLCAEERERLEAIIKSGNRSAQLITKARILLKADTSDAAKVGRTAKSRRRWIPASTPSVARDDNWSGGLRGDAGAQIQFNSARPRIFDGATEAELIALACSPAPEGFARWSLRLLEEKVVELDIVEKASDNTIGRTLKKTLSNRTAIGNG